MSAASCHVHVIALPCTLAQNCSMFEQSGTSGIACLGKVCLLHYRVLKDGSILLSVNISQSQQLNENGTLMTSSDKGIVFLKNNLPGLVNAHIASSNSKAASGKG